MVCKNGRDQANSIKFYSDKGRLETERGGAEQAEGLRVGRPQGSGTVEKTTETKKCKRDEGVSENTDEAKEARAKDQKNVSGVGGGALARLSELPLSEFVVMCVAFHSGKGCGVILYGSGSRFPSQPFSKVRRAVNPARPILAKEAAATGRRGEKRGPGAACAAACTAACAGSLQRLSPQLVLERRFHQALEAAGGSHAATVSEFALWRSGAFCAWSRQKAMVSGTLCCSKSVMAAW